MALRLLTDLTLCTMAGPEPYGTVEDGALALEDGRIAYAGPIADLPERFRGVVAESQGGRVATPALIDCHTHLVFGGDRAREFEMRLTGKSYEEIARAGGGIVSTVAATRALDAAALADAARPRLDALLAEGVGTVEIKSGYGLETETELRMLRAARRLGEVRAVGVATSFLGAHAVPPGMTAEDYTALVCDAMLPAVAAAGLADAVDVFHESIAFSAAQTERVFAAARAHGNDKWLLVVGSLLYQAHGILLCGNMAVFCWRIGNLAALHKLALCVSPNN